MYSKRCASCGLGKPAEDFSVDRSRHDGLLKYCRSCNKRKAEERITRIPNHEESERIRKRDYQRAKRAGTYVPRPPKQDKTRPTVDHDVFLKLQEEQGGLCALCSKEKKLLVDHCHITDVIRGLLCIRCNFALAQLTEDDISRLDRVRAYLRRAHSDGELG